MEIETVELLERVKRASLASVSNPYRIAFTSIFAFLTLVLFAISTDVPWHLQTLQAGVGYWDDAFLNGIAGIRLGGLGTFVLTLVYSLLSGLALTNVAVQLTNSRLPAKEFSSLLPGFAATGCASCGLGIAGVLGLTGAAAALPLGGDLLKLLGVALIIYALYSFGDPEICDI